MERETKKEASVHACVRVAKRGKRGAGRELFMSWGYESIEEGEE